MSKLLIEYGVDPRAWRLISEFDFSKIQMDDQNESDEILEYFHLQPNINENVDMHFIHFAKTIKISCNWKISTTGAKYAQIYFRCIFKWDPLIIIKYLLWQGAGSCSQ